MLGWGDGLVNRLLRSRVVLFRVSRQRRETAPHRDFRLSPEALKSLLPALRASWEGAQPLLSGVLGDCRHSPSASVCPSFPEPEKASDALRMRATRMLCRPQ